MDFSGKGAVVTGASGGMGEVYRARDLRLDREVAIKILSSGIPSDPEQRERLKLEARMLAALIAEWGTRQVLELRAARSAFEKLGAQGMLCELDTDSWSS